MTMLNDWVELLRQLPVLAYVLAAVLGLCVGSFLNVVIYRLPRMMELRFRQECQLFLAADQYVPTDAPDTPPSVPVMTLSQPASSCPHCHAKIRWYDNIPLISWLALRGRCRRCGASISVRYPLVELATALLSVLVVWQFGVGIQALTGLMLTWVLIALTGIDFDTQLLPDSLTLPLAGLGLFVNAFGVFVSPVQAIFGYVVGFLCLWVVYKLFLLVTGKEGMGYGDFKLLAALGAWLGVSMLPLIVFLSAVVGSIIGVILLKRVGESRPFAFGPFIAIAGMVALLFGQDILQWYLGGWH